MLAGDGTAARPTLNNVRGARMSRIRWLIPTHLALAARAAKRDVRRGTADLLVAATADAHGLTLLTRDERLARLPGLTAELV